MTIKTTKNQVTEYKYGQMGQNTKDFGKMIWQKTTGDLFWPTVMCTLDTGARIRLMEMASISMRKVLRTKVDGLMISKKEKGMKHGLMVLFTKVITLMARKKVTDSLNGLMELCTMVVGKTTKWMEPEISNGLTVDNIQANI